MWFGVVRASILPQVGSLFFSLLLPFYCTLTYYEHITQAQYNAPALHSGNLYQIFTYVKNKEAELAGTEHHVSGMLLYAKTDEELIPDNQYQMSGNRIFVRTLDLAEDFAGIRKQLDELVTECFAKIS